MLSEREHQHQTLEVEARPRQAFPTKAAPEPFVSGTSNSAAPRSPTLGYVIGSVGVAGLITGAVTGVLLLQKKAFVDDHCPAKRFDPQGLEATKSGETLGIVTTACLITGVVGVGAGTYLVLSAGSGVDPSAASLAFGGTF